MPSRALVIGLDCAAPQLVFDRWLDELPAIRSLTERGSYGILRSCDPPITVPAWSVMTSSRSPGVLGFYGFRNRKDHSYDALTFANSRSVQVPRVWDLLSDKGRPVVVLGVPQTYPVSEVNGVMVSCFLTPDVKRNQYTHPPELKEEIEALVGEYMVDVPNFRTNDKDRLLEDLETMTVRRFQVAERLLETRPWDLFFMVEMGTDRIHHGFWRFTDPEHRLYEPGNPYEDAMLSYYRRLDEKIARLLAKVDEDTAVLVVSDHGAKRIDGGICVNEWLRREGYLTLKEEPPEPMPLKPDMVDWSRTVAWGEGGYYCRLFLNVAGREPEGTVAPEDYERVRDELKAKLEALGDEQRSSDRDGRVPARGALRGAERRRARPDGLLRRPPLAERRPGRHRHGARLRERHGARRREPRARRALRAGRGGRRPGPRAGARHPRRRTDAPRPPRRARARRDGGNEPPRSGACASMTA